MSGAGTRLQRERGIDDDPIHHYRDLRRIIRRGGNHALIRRSIALQPKIIDWLMDEGFAIAPGMPQIYHGHEAYTIPRTYWGEDRGLSILAVLQRALEPLIVQGLVELRLSTPATALLIDAGVVSGVETADGQRIVGRATVLTTGGYANSPEVFKSLHPDHILRSGAWEYSCGNGLTMALAAGAQLTSTGLYLSSYGGVWNHIRKTPRYVGVAGLIPQIRQPWEIIVNAAGARFIAEDGDSVDERERALMRQPNSEAFVVFDDAIFRHAPAIFDLRWTDGKDPATFFEANPEHFFVADTVEALASQAGIDPGGLVRSIADYNSALTNQTPDPTGRKYRPAPIATAPFRAFRIAAFSVKSYAGLSVNTDLHVLNTDGRAIMGLYAAGEVLGGGTFSGDAFAGGMSVTPALAFGQLLGENLSIARGGK